MPQPHLRTERLVLVPLADEHLDLEVELDSDPEVLRYLWGRARSRDEVERSHAERLAHADKVEGLGFWMAFTHDGDCVGLMMLPPAHGPDQPDDPTIADLGYRIFRRHWRQGYASEASTELLRHAFETVGLRKVRGGAGRGRVRHHRRRVAQYRDTSTYSAGVIATWGRGWRGVVVAVVALGIASLLSNITTDAQLLGEDQAWFAIRRTMSLLLNSGTAWAGVSVLAGFLVCRPARRSGGLRAAALAGLIAGSGALLVHYGLGELTGLMPPGSFGSNVFWFVAAAVTGAPLGLIGAWARRPSLWGLAARFVVPAGAVLEPFVTGWWSSGWVTTPAERTSTLAAAVLLTALGVLGAAVVLRSRGQHPGRVTNA